MVTRFALDSDVTNKVSEPVWASDDAVAHIKRIARFFRYELESFWVSLPYLLIGLDVKTY